MGPLQVCLATDRHSFSNIVATKECLFHQYTSDTATNLISIFQHNVKSKGADCIFLASIFCQFWLTWTRCFVSIRPFVASIRISVSSSINSMLNNVKYVELYRGGGSNCHILIINIWDIATKVVRLSSAYQGPSNEPNYKLLSSVSTKVTHLNISTFSNWHALPAMQINARIDNLLK